MRRCACRGWIAQMYDQEVADAIRIQYGGSVTPEVTAVLPAPRSPGIFAACLNDAMSGLARCFMPAVQCGRCGGRCGSTLPT